jgi:phosphoribosylformylglycinamidine synthase
VTLSPADRDRVVAELDREPTRTEAALFENLWSEHCAYRSSAPLLEAFDSESPRVVVGPGDDAAVVAVGGDDSETHLTVGVESHNHPSYVDPYDGAATGVGGIVRDTLSMGAYPVALADPLYFGPFADDHPRYLFEGVVEGIADYGNAIGVPTVAGSVAFHAGYEGNPLVNVACVGLTRADRYVTAEARAAGNALVLVGNATGRDGLGGAAFASEDLDEDAATEDRPAVQVGDPYAEKRLIEANETLLDEGLVVSARDLGAAGLGGASCELVAKGGLGARVDLDAVHLREDGMSPTEILLSESQERMCYEVAPGDVAAVERVAERFDLGVSVVGEVTTGDYVCRFGDETVVRAPAAFLADGAPAHDLARVEPTPPARDLPAEDDVEDAVSAVLSNPSTASKAWVYRQYDHEVGLRTVVRPGADAALLSVDEADADVALSAGSVPSWTACEPYDGARGVALEVATDLAALGATPLAAVDCLNGGNPETPETYGGFAATVDGLADACRALSVPVVGGNVSLYNDSESGPVPPTPTVAMVGERAGETRGDPPGLAATGDGALLLVGASDGALGGSTYLGVRGGTDRFPALPDDPRAVVDRLAAVARAEPTRAVHDVSRGGLAATLAEMVGDAGVAATVPDRETLFCEAPGRAVVETTDPAAVRAAFDGVAPVTDLGRTTDEATLSLAVDGTDVALDAGTIRERREVIARALD